MFMTIAFVFGSFFGWKLHKKRQAVMNFFKLEKVNEDEK